MEPAITRHTFKAEEYFRMAEAGILTEDDRVELIRGEIIAMSPISNRHMVCVNKLTWLLTGLARKVAIVSVQNPVHLDEYSVPEPDIVLFRFRDDFYAGGEPKVEDVLLVVEVSDSTLEYDRRVKVPLYGQAGIPEVWVVDLNGRIIEVYTHPIQGTYSRIKIVQGGEKLVLSAINDAVVEADKILG
jgi:Uma2 family endonuclease